MRIDERHLPWHDLNGRLTCLICVVNDALVVLITVRTDDLILLGDERREIHTETPRREPWIAGMGGIVDQTGRLDQVLGGQAAPVDTGAAQGAPLGHHRRFAQLLGMDGSGEGSRATTQNQQIIDVVLQSIHGIFLVAGTPSDEASRSRNGSRDSTGTQVGQASSTSRFGRARPNKNQYPSASATTK